MSRGLTYWLLVFIIFLFGILVSASGFNYFQSQLLFILCAGIITVAFYFFIEPHLDKEIQTVEPGKNEGEAVSGASSWWHRETPMVSEEQARNGIYAVSDKGYVQAAVIFSFILPGLGQTYNGQYLKGVVLTISALALVWAIGMWALIFWLIGAVDAYLSAKKIISHNLRPTSGNAFFLHISFGVYFMLGLTVVLTTLFKRA